LERSAYLTSWRDLSRFARIVAYSVDSLGLLALKDSGLFCDP